MRSAPEKSSKTDKTSSNVYFNKDYCVKTLFTAPAQTADSFGWPKETSSTLRDKNQRALQRAGRRKPSTTV